MRAIVYYVPQPMPYELHGLERLVYDQLSMAEAQTLMDLPTVREPHQPLATLVFRDRVFFCHEDNRVLIRNHWGITDVHVANRRYLVKMLIPAEDLGTLEEGDDEAHA